MSGKQILLLGLCTALFCVLQIFHWPKGKRRPVLGLLMLSILWLGVSPLLYKLAPGMFPRVTIGWPLLLMLSGMVWYFTPALGRADAQVTDDDFDSTIPTAPAPLSTDRPVVH